MMRPVTIAFSANDREKNDSGNEFSNLISASDELLVGAFAMVVTEVTRGTLA